MNAVKFVTTRVMVELLIWRAWKGGVGEAMAREARDVAKRALTSIVCVRALGQQNETC